MQLKVSILLLCFLKIGVSSTNVAFLDDNFRTKIFWTIFRQSIIYEGVPRAALIFVSLAFNRTPVDTTRPRMRG